MTEERKTRFSREFHAGESRNYSVNVWEADKTAKPYLILGESRKTNGIWKSSRLVLFPEQAQSWKQTLEEAISHLE